jgi:hypothetical protein
MSEVSDFKEYIYKKAEDLTSNQRKELDPNVFGLPEQRKFPMPDAEHVRKAWQFLGRSKLSPDQKDQVKTKIFARAKELGIDTSNWNIQKSASEDVPDKKEDTFRGAKAVAKMNAIDNVLDVVRGGAAVGAGIVASSPIRNELKNAIKNPKAIKKVLFETPEAKNSWKEFGKMQKAAVPAGLALAGIYTAIAARDDLKHKKEMQAGQAKSATVSLLKDRIYKEAGIE